MRAVNVVVLIAACGGRSAPPGSAPPSPPPDAARLARALDDDLVQLGEIARRHRGQCVELLDTLEPHVARMQAHHAEVRQALEDSTRAAELKRALDSFAAHAKGRFEGIAEDLAATYMTCTDCSTDAACRYRYRLERAISAMPTY